MKKLIFVVIFIFSFIYLCFSFAKCVMLSRDITGYFAEKAVVEIVEDKE